MDISAPAAPPLLVAGGTRDPGTPYEAAEAVVGKLGNGSHLMRYSGEGHGYFVRSECVRAAFISYLTNPEAYTPVDCPD
jgi:pimeloyl-ACP methyl ester carboxylesterase